MTHHTVVAPDPIVTCHYSDCLIKKTICHVSEPPEVHTITTSSKSIMSRFHSLSSLSFRNKGPHISDTGKQHCAGKILNCERNLQCSYCSWDAIYLHFHVIFFVSDSESIES